MKLSCKIFLRDIEKATKYGPDANLEKRDLPSSMRDPVQARTKKVDLESGVGKTKGMEFDIEFDTFGTSKFRLVFFYHIIPSKPYHLKMEIMEKDLVVIIVQCVM